MSIYAGDVMCLVIPYVGPNVSQRTIFNIFKNQGWGFIHHITDFRNNGSSKVFIHFSEWNGEFDYKRKFFQSDPNNHSRIYYNYNRSLYWKVSEARGFRNWRHKMLGIENEYDHKGIKRPSRCNTCTWSSSNSIDYDEPVMMELYSSDEENY